MDTIFVRSSYSGAGFVTHADQENDGLSFEVFGELIQVTGDLEKIDNWVKRVSGEVLTKDTFDLEKVKAEKAGVIIKINELQLDTAAAQTKLGILQVFIDSKG